MIKLWSGRRGVRERRSVDVRRLGRSSNAEVRQGPVRGDHSGGSRQGRSVSPRVTTQTVLLATLAAPPSALAKGCETVARARRPPTCLPGELRDHVNSPRGVWSGRRGSNSRPLPWQGTRGSATRSERESRHSGGPSALPCAYFDGGQATFDQDPVRLRSTGGWWNGEHRLGVSLAARA